MNPNPEPDDTVEVIVKVEHTIRKNVPFRLSRKEVEAFGVRLEDSEPNGLTPRLTDFMRYDQDIEEVLDALVDTPGEIVWSDSDVRSVRLVDPERYRPEPEPEEEGRSIFGLRFG